MSVSRSAGGARPRRWRGILIGLVLALGVTLAACGQSAPAGVATTLPAAAPASSPPAPAGSATRTSEGGQVTIKVTWNGPGAGPVFAVVMDTHAVDLDGYDLRQLAVLRTDQGREVRPSGWDAPTGGHHREGKLAFPATAADGTPVIGPGTRSLELIVRDVAGVAERRFQWAVSA